MFICTNQRAEGKECCSEERGLALVAEFKKLMKEKGLNIEMRAQRTGCFDMCSFGPVVGVYPEGVFYGGVQLTDVEEIVNGHLIKNEPVKRLIIDFEANNKS